MNPTVLNFFVGGKAATAGSKRAFNMPGMKFPIVIDDCKDGKKWRKVVQLSAIAAGAKQVPPWEGPLKATFEFCMARPKCHFRTGANSAQHRSDAPVHPISRPDLLKLSRAIEDALTNIIWKDDSQIVEEILTKRYSPIPGVYITIERVP